MSEKVKLAVSIVLYKNNRDELTLAINSVLASHLSIILFLIDNSPDDSLRNLTSDSRVVYIFNNGDNLGFGKAHNIALRQAFSLSEFHLVMNPDIRFDPGTLENLIHFIESDPSIGLVMPKVLDNHGNIQYLCKKLPAPFDLLIRRFGNKFVKNLFRERLLKMEMRERDYNQIFAAPYLSGCFLLMRVTVLEEVGLFDEKFFMYMEDIDISRRIAQKYKTMYFPKAQVFHGHARDSYKSLKMLIVHIQSSIRYFNKWGWVYDKDRSYINNSH